MNKYREALLLLTKLKIVDETNKHGLLKKEHKLKLKEACCNLEELIDKFEYYKWHKFNDDPVFNHYGDFPEDGKWVLVCDKNGKHHTARFKHDAYNHFFPSSTVELEDCVAWRYVDWYKVD